MLYRWSALMLVLLITGCTTIHEEELVIGAVIPLTGPAAVWGESLQDGMRIAQEELAQQGRTIAIEYQDSEANPTTAVSAYRQLRTTHQPDVIISSLSSATTPLLALSTEDEQLLLMTQVAANNIVTQHPYAYRYFMPAQGYIDTFITYYQEPPESIAILAVGDEMGSSMQTAIESWTTQDEIELIHSELYTSGTQDFRTELVKMQEAEVIFFASIAPSDLITFVNQYRELDIQAQLVAPSTTLSSPGVRKKLGESAEGIYTVAHGFDLAITGEELAQQYQETYDAQPLYTVALGYDMIHLLAQNTPDIKAGLDSLSVFSGANGEILITQRGEFNPEVYPVVIQDGKLTALTS